MITEETLRHWWLRIPVLLYAIGLWVHNAYLSTNAIYDFSLLQAKYAYIGAVAAVFSAIILAFLLIRLDLDHPSRNLNLIRLLSWIGRAGALAVSIAFLTRGVHGIVSDDLMSGMGERGVIRLLFPLQLCTFTVFMTFATTPKVHPWLHRIEACYSVPLWCVIIILSINGSPISGPATRVANLFGLIFLYCVGFKDAESGVKPPQVVDGDSAGPLAARFKRAFNWLLVALLFSAVVQGYSTHIYPLIPRAWGGARPVAVVLHVDDEVFEGALIDDNEGWISIQRDGELVRLPVSEVTLVEMKEP